MIAIITAIYDQYDTLKPAYAQNIDAEWVLVTDDASLQSVSEIDGWRVIYEPHIVHPNRAAKHPKMRPWLYTDATSSVWIDASFRVVSATFAQDVLSYADPIAQFVHPWRDCIYDEAIASALPKYAGEPITAQVDHYRAEGHPASWGLWATGIIARHHTAHVVEFGDAWLDECYMWSFQDQLSHPYVLRKLSLRPNSLPGTHFHNPWLRYEGSLRH